MSNPRVSIAVPLYGRVSANHHINFIDVVLTTAVDGFLLSPQFIEGSYCDFARNELVRNSLVNNPTHILFMDHDVIAPADVVRRLLAHNVPIAGGTYFLKRPPNPACAWMNDPNSDGFFLIERLLPGLQEVGGMGLGCVLIEANVFRRMAEHYGDEDWFRINGLRVSGNSGEDHWFFHRCNELGIPVYLDGDLLCGHVAENIITVEHHYAATGYSPGTVLDVGCGPRGLPLPVRYAGWRRVRLDIDPSVEPDVIADARDLSMIEPESIDAVYCAHNLEHYEPEDVPKVLASFHRVLKPGGKIHVIVPDMEQAAARMVENGGHADEVAYQAPVGPITIGDILHGHRGMRADNAWMEHHTHFGAALLKDVLSDAGFDVSIEAGNWELVATGTISSRGI